jgi:hypothetical protein
MVTPSQMKLCEEILQWAPIVAFFESQGKHIVASEPVPNLALSETSIVTFLVTAFPDENYLGFKKKCAVNFTLRLVDTHRQFRRFQDTSRKIN